MDDRVVLVGLILMLATIIALLVFASTLRTVAYELRATAEHERLNLVRLEESLARIEAGDRVVAKNLEHSIDRADKADDTIPGASADAALRRGSEYGH